MVNMGKYISWRRVSTTKQGASGLGLEAQKEIIRYFIERDGGEWVADYSECYTGTELSGCVELAKAMEHCKQIGAVLIIAKSDRFRNTIEALQVYEEMGDGNIMFCDLPHTDKFTLTLFFALAEREALLVSIRTKQALAAKKARGEKTGGAADAWRKKHEAKSREQRRHDADAHGASKTQNYLASKDVQAFLKCLRHVFPEETTNPDSSLWEWGRINTKGDNKSRLLSMMKSFNGFDSSLFTRWDFSLDEKANQVKLATYIATLRKSINNNSRITKNENK